MVNNIIIMLIGVMLALSSYFLFVLQAIRIKKDWRRTFNEEHPYIKNPYLVKPALLFPIAALLIFSLITLWQYNLTILESEKTICIESIQEWDEMSGLITATSHHAFINKQYTLLFERPHQYGIGDCFILYKYKVEDWRLDKVD